MASLTRWNQRNTPSPSKRRMQAAWTVLAAVFAIIIVSALVSLPGNAQEATETDPAAFFFFGPRLHTDMAFYLQGGFKTDIMDATVGIGFNDSVWLGAHGYFLDTGGEDLDASVFAGVELHIDQSTDTMMLNPAFSIGFAVNAGPLLVILDALIVPVAEGQPVATVVALSFNFGFPFGG